jgi:hypothetical protein
VHEVNLVGEFVELFPEVSCQDRAQTVDTVDVAGPGFVEQAREVRVRKPPVPLPGREVLIVGRCEAELPIVEAFEGELYSSINNASATLFFGRWNGARLSRARRMTRSRSVAVGSKC